jgi:hypothetical protein
MTISLQPKYFESDRTYLRTVESDLKRQIISVRNTARKSGLICNFSKYDLLVWFGRNVPVNNADWLVIPARSNCDIPMFFTGEIHGFWTGNDNKTAKIYEFYGD